MVREMVVREIRAGEMGEREMGERGTKERECWEREMEEGAVPRCVDLRPQTCSLLEEPAHPRVVDQQVLPLWVRLKMRLPQHLELDPPQVRLGVEALQIRLKVVPLHLRLQEVQRPHDS